MFIVYIVSTIVFIITAVLKFDHVGEKMIVVICSTTLSCLFTALFIEVFSDVYIRDHESELTYYTSEVSRTNIRTLSDNITGNFSLGFGSINSESRFYFYVKTSDSSLYLKSIPADGVKIFNKNDVNPSVVKYEKYIDWSKSEISWWLFKLEDKTEYYYIYVPKNTDIKQYTLDVQ